MGDWSENVYLIENPVSIVFWCCCENNYLVIIFKLLQKLIKSRSRIKTEIILRHHLKSALIQRIHKMDQRLVHVQNQCVLRRYTAFGRKKSWFRSYKCCRFFDLLCVVELFVQFWTFKNILYNILRSFHILLNLNLWNSLISHLRQHILDKLAFLQNRARKLLFRLYQLIDISGRLGHRYHLFGLETEPFEESVDYIG